MLDSSRLYGSRNRLGITTISLSEFHKERMESIGLDMHLRLELLMDFRIHEKKLLIDAL